LYKLNLFFLPFILQKMCPQEHNKRIMQWSIPSLSLLILGLALDLSGKW
jgi:hypothetical protein